LNGTNFPGREHAGKGSPSCNSFAKPLDFAASLARHLVNVDHEKLRLLCDMGEQASGKWVPDRLAPGK
jgi:hypothetical protein